MSGWRSRASQLISGAGSATHRCRDVGLMNTTYLPSSASSPWATASRLARMEPCCLRFTTKDQIKHKSKQPKTIGPRISKTDPTDPKLFFPDTNKKETTTKNEHNPAQMHFAVNPIRFIFGRSSITTQSDANASSPSSGQKEGAI